ncbi:MAG: NADH-quinone oxidoreductase subunit L [Coriobacteriales bacterium]
METIAQAVLGGLIVIPAVVAALLLAVRADKPRTFITVIGALVIACLSILAAAVFLPQSSQGTLYYAVPEGLSHAVSYVTLAIDLVLAVYVIGKGLANKKYLAPVLALVQAVLITWFELAVAHKIEVAQALYVDNLTVIMILVIGIIGSGICVYALGYMRDHERHNSGKDRRPTFFALMFVFLSAMFAIVVCNNLTWMLCAWEVTTVCSFALIGYTRTQEAINNANRQIVLNLIGGLAFAAALVWVGSVYGVMELDRFIELTQTYTANGYSFLTVMPVLLLALAGFTKAAQMPFQSWLLGAMVAPTPTSALLHSSTMVKAGVFLLIKLAPCLGSNLPGYVVMFVGGTTFIMCALAAINMSNAKRVLAYSTISNLGLITLCAGIGTAAAIWAAIFLLVFHAAAKSLLFLCVGTAEHHVGSRDIESFDQLFEKMPTLARLMALGILVMFVAPFGMLISKWAAFQAIIVSGNVVLILVLAFGSAATFMFWAKWLGKILSIAHAGDENVELTVYRSEWASMGLMTVLALGMCIGFPIISGAVVVPFLDASFGGADELITDGNMWIMAVLSFAVALVFLLFKGTTKKRVVPVYMAGAGIDFDQRTYLNSFGAEAKASQRNWYMEDVFGEKKMTLIGLAVSLTLLAGGFGYAVDSTAQNKDNLLTTVTAQACYRGSLWEQSGVEFDEYLNYYAYYGAAYDEYADEYREMGINSREELMDALFMQYAMQSAYGTGTDGYDYGEE